MKNIKKLLTNISLPDTLVLTISIKYLSKTKMSCISGGYEYE